MAVKPQLGINILFLHHRTCITFTTRCSIDLQCTVAMGAEAVQMEYLPDQTNRMIIHTFLLLL